MGLPKYTTPKMPCIDVINVCNVYQKSVINALVLINVTRNVEKAETD